MSRLEVGILGPLEVRVDGHPVSLGGAKQRTLIALLAARAGGPVSVERIIDELWGEEPPASAAQSVQMHVSRLRQALATERSGEIIVTAPPGYQLTADATIDARQFESLLDEAQAIRSAGDLDEARGQLSAALALWRGDALTAVEQGQVLAIEAARLDSELLYAQLDRIEIDMELGRHDAVVAELEALALRYPLQERIRALLMTALYRSSRQAEALDVYRDTSRLLMDELALEPTQRLQDLERAILRQDPSLATPGPEDSEPVDTPATSATPVARRSRGPLIATGAIVLASVALAIFVSGNDKTDLKRIDANAVGVVDTSSGRVVAQVPTGGRPVSLAASQDAVWIADADRGLLLRVEPGVARTIDTVPIGEGTAAVAAGAGAVWAVAGNTHTLSRVNVGTNDVVQRIPVGNGARAVAVGAGSVWVANGLDSTISRIDARTGRQISRIPVGALPSGIAVGEGGVWVANESDGTVTRINPSRGSPVSTIRVGSGPVAITAGLGGVWVANADDGTISRIDPRTDTVTATVAAGSRPVAVAVADGALWVGGTDGLRRIDPRSVRVTRTYRLRAAHSALVAVGGRLWTAAQATPDSHRGGTLRLAGSAESTSLDPARAELGDRTSALQAVVADGLIGHRRGGGTAGAALVPDLARALPDRTEGGLTYRFQLRRGLRYASGAPVRARDVRASIERLHLMGAEGLGVFPLGLRGEDRCNRTRCDLSSGIRTDDDTGTVTVHLRRPNPDFLLNLAVPVYSVLPSGSAPSDLTGPALVGTGPYRIASRSTDEVTLERNPRFRAWSREAQPDGFPDRIVWTLSGAKADILVDPTAQQLDRLAVLAPTRVRRQPRSFLAYAWLNTKVPPFNRLDARRAVATALDRRRFLPGSAHSVAGLSSRTTCQILSPGLPGYDPSCTLGEPDLDRARRLVKRSATAGMRVRFWVVKNPFWRRFGRQFVRTLRSIGYRAVLESRFDPPEHLAFTLGPRSRAQAGANAWIGDKPRASNMIEPLLMCPRANFFGVNEAHFCDPALDARMRTAHDLEATEPATANAIWAGLDRELVRRAPIVPILSGESAQVTSERIGNYEYHLRYGPLLAQAWVK